MAGHLPQRNHRVRQEDGADYRNPGPQGFRECRGMGHGPLRPTTVVRNRSRAFPNQPHRQSPAGRIHRLARSRLQKFCGRSIGRQRQTVALRNQRDILLRHNGPKYTQVTTPKMLSVTDYSDAAILIDRTETYIGGFKGVAIVRDRRDSPDTIQARELFLTNLNINNHPQRPGGQEISAQMESQRTEPDRTQPQAKQHLARFHHTLFRIRDRQLQIPDKGAQQRMVRTGDIALPRDQQHALRQIHA